MSERFVAYYRVSTQKQGIHGLGMDAQRQSVKSYLSTVASADLIDSFEEVESGKRSDRPALAAAIQRCKLTNSKLLIAKLDRLSRDVHFLTGLQHQGIDFVCCDMPFANKLTINIMAAVAQDERERGAARTREALAVIKAKLANGQKHVGKRSGKPVERLGNPKGLSQPRRDLGVQAVIQRADTFAAKVGPTIVSLREGGMPLRAIAERLNAMKVPTSMGAEWSPTAVKRVFDRLAA